MIRRSAWQSATNQASFLGTAGESCALINVGTGSQISIPVQGYCKTELLETRPLCGEDYILVGSSLCGGRAFAILEHFFADVVQMATGTRPENLYPAMDEMLKTPHDTTVRIDPRFSGTRTDPSLRARILELSEDNFTARDLCWAMLWGMTDDSNTLYHLSKHRLQTVCRLRKRFATQSGTAPLHGTAVWVPHSIFQKPRRGCRRGSHVRIMCRG